MAFPTVEIKDYEDRPNIFAIRLPSGRWHDFDRTTLAAEWAWYYHLAKCDNHVTEALQVQMQNAVDSLNELDGVIPFTEALGKGDATEYDTELAYLVREVGRLSIEGATYLWSHTVNPMVAATVLGTENSVESTEDGERWALVDAGYLSRLRDAVNPTPDATSISGGAAALVLGAEVWLEIARKRWPEYETNPDHGRAVNLYVAGYRAGFLAAPAADAALAAPASVTSPQNQSGSDEEMSQWRIQAISSSLSTFPADLDRTSSDLAYWVCTARDLVEALKVETSRVEALTQQRDYGRDIINDMTLEAASVTSPVGAAGAVNFDTNKLWAYLDEVIDLHTSAESGHVHRHLSKHVVETLAKQLAECVTPAALTTPIEGAATSSAVAGGPAGTVKAQARAAELKELADNSWGELGSINQQMLFYLGFKEAFDMLAAGSPTPIGEEAAANFQGRVAKWMQETFGPEVSADFTERGFRFGEEAIELLQANGTTKEDILKLVDYVYGRPVGELQQEVGGTMVTLAALCQARDIDLMTEATTEQNRVESPAIRAKIQAKQADKRARMIASPLPGTAPTSASKEGSHD